MFLIHIVGQQHSFQNLPIGAHILMFLAFSFSILVLLIQIHHEICLIFLVLAVHLTARDHNNGLTSLNLLNMISAYEVSHRLPSSVRTLVGGFL